MIRIAAVVALASLAALVPAAQGTTEPVEEVDVYVTLRDSGITLSRKDAVRGAVARFIVHNLGKKPHSFELGKGNVTAVRTGLSTPVIKPRATTGSVSAATSTTSLIIMPSNNDSPRTA